MKVTVNDQEYKVELEPDMHISVKEGIAIERALGLEWDALQKSKSLQMPLAVIWTLLKRQVPTARIDDVDFDLREFFAEQEELSEEDDVVDPPVEASDSMSDASDI